MANYPKELLDLVKEYLTDGVITAKERHVLINKATALGVDPDEFDLYIDAQVQKLQNAATEAAREQQGKLCPFCQASLPMFADRCPECGSNITPEASKEVETLINTLEEALVSFKAIAANDIIDNEAYETKKAEIERYIRKAKMYYTNNKTVNFLVEDIEKAVAISEKKIAALKSALKKKKIIKTIGISIAIGIGFLLSGGWLILEILLDW